MSLKIKPTPNIFSIVTPSYNQGQFLAQTIESILSQSGNFYIDYLIMDGGSCDSSVNIIKKYEKSILNGSKLNSYRNHSFYQPQASKFNQNLGISYRWVSQRDKGQVDALKKGFDLAIGDYFNFLNSDDYFLTSKVFSLIQTIFVRNPQASIVTGDGIFVTKEGREIGIHHVKRINFIELLYLDYHILQPSTFVRSSIHQNNYLNEKYVCAFDGEYYIHLMAAGHNLIKIDQQLSAFRFYPDNKTLSLAPLRYRENMSIGWRYCKNPWFFLISSIYRFLEIILKPRINHPLFIRLFSRCQNIAYKIIIHEAYTQRV